MFSRVPPSCCTTFAANSTTPCFPRYQFNVVSDQEGQCWGAREALGGAVLGGERGIRRGSVGGRERD